MVSPYTSGAHTSSSESTNGNVERWIPEVKGGIDPLADHWLQMTLKLRTEPHGEVPARQGAATACCLRRPMAGPSPRAVGALLPDAGLLDRRRGCPAGRLVAGVARSSPVRGAGFGARLALSHRHQRLPHRPAEGEWAKAA